MRRCQEIDQEYVEAFVRRACAMEVGQEFFQCHVSCLPDVEGLREVMKMKASTMRFKIWPVINGTMIRREE